MCSPWNKVTIEVRGTLLKQVTSSSILRNWEEAHVPVQQFHKETHQYVITQTHSTFSIYVLLPLLTKTVLNI